MKRAAAGTEARDLRAENAALKRVIRLLEADVTRRNRKIQRAITALHAR